MAEKNFNKNKNYNKPLNSKIAAPITMETDRDMHKPTRGLPRT